MENDEAKELTTVELGGGDLLEYLEESELYKCEQCGYDVIIQEFRYCPNCGKEIDWNAYKEREKARLAEQRKKQGYKPGVYAQIIKT